MISAAAASLPGAKGSQSRHQNDPGKRIHALHSGRHVRRRVFRHRHRRQPHTPEWLSKTDRGACSGRRNPDRQSTGKGFGSDQMIRSQGGVDATSRPRSESTKSSTSSVIKRSQNNSCPGMIRITGRICQQSADHRSDPGQPLFCERNRREHCCRREDVGRFVPGIFPLWQVRSIVVVVTTHVPFLPRSPAHGASGPSLSRSDSSPKRWPRLWPA